MAKKPKVRSPRRRKRQWIVALTLLALIIFAGWYLNSSAFHSYVRGRLIAKLEEVTGGHADIGRVEWNLSKLEFIFYGVTIHGREAAPEAPFVHIDRVYVRAKILSLLRRQIGLLYLEADHPVIHIITYPDGTTNQPAPVQRVGTANLQNLFELAADRMELRDGVFILNEQNIPLDVSAGDVRAVLTFDRQFNRYDGTLHIGTLYTQYLNFRPVVAVAQMEFSVLPKALAVKKLEISSDRSRITITGSITDFREPDVQASYTASINIGQAGEIMLLPRLRSGTANVEGTATYHAGRYRASGRVSVHNAAFADGGMVIPSVTGQGNFLAENQGISITGVHGTALGGSFTGSGRMEIAATPDFGRPTPQRGSAEVRFSGLDAEQVRRVVSSAQLQGVPMHGRTSGTVEARWVGGAANATATITMNVTPPAQPAPGEMAVSAEFRGEYSLRTGGLSISQLQLSSPGTTVQASGLLGRRTGELKLNVSSANFAELQSLLSIIGSKTDLPFEIHGSTAFTGTISGNLASPVLRGHVVFTDLDYLSPAGGPLPALHPAKSVARPPQRVPFDRLTADVEYSDDLFIAQSALLQFHSSSIALAGQATLVKGRVVDSSRLDLRFNFQHEDAERLQLMLDFSVPLTGAVSGTFRLAGTADNPSGNGLLRLLGGEIYGQPFAAAANVQISDHEAQFSNLEMAQGTARITGAGAYYLTTGAVRFRLRGSGFALANFPALQLPQLSIAGTASFSAEGSGTPEAPLINGSLQIANLTLNGESVGEFSAQAATHGEMLELAVSTSGETAQSTMKGSIRLRDDFPAQLKIDFPRFDLDPLLRIYLHGRLTGHSLAAGSVEIAGPLKHWRQMTLTGTLSQFSASIEKISLSNRGPVRFRVANGIFTLDEFHITGSETDLNASGSVGLAEDAALNLRAGGTLDLHLLQTLDPNISSSGRLSLAVRVGGTRLRPDLQGQVQVSDGNVAYSDLPNGLADVNGTLVFNADRLQVQTLTGHSGGGNVMLTGYFAWQQGLYVDLSAHIREMRLRYPQGVSSVANADLRLTGTPENSLLSGDLVLTRFGFNPDFDFGLYIARMRPGLMTTGVSAVNNLRLDLHVVSTPELQVSTSLAKLSGEIDLRIRGTASKPSVLGRITILEGSIFFNGTKYQLQRGDISFLNPTAIQPVLNMEITTRVAGYDITLSLHGPVDRLHTTYRSDPPLPTQDVIALLAFHQCPASAEFSCAPSAIEQAQSGGTVPTSWTETASNQILGEALNATLSNRVQRLFGISRVKISPEVGTATSNPGARVTIEQQVSNKITITYITDVVQATQQVIQVEYNLNKSVSFVAVRDQFGVVSLDIRIRRRHR